ncbi:helix-turn-helix domain-containing protein [Bombilactobacillus folatiphilus]|uniref:Helix-turn-helix domain-containing protein n=1 Tax=Bombilactobacillus folatiphilus TaxID=2923362 RepID=A0ABY4P7I8_9LACO|nr:helix-turn-helix transcriptional regulator [Bombilactobacillus folatiphilus]UQS81550.1 helix-turn-helix domain-containing protein [Bombilactobacillus folatiphilus]
MARIDKKTLKEIYVHPQTKLKALRINNGLTTAEMAELIGLKNRRQYEQKERGKAPFHDYEMYIISHKFHVSIKHLFYDWDT